MTPKKARNFRLSALTNSQLEELAQHWGTSLTETHAIIIDRVYRAQFGENVKLGTLAEIVAKIKKEVLDELREHQEGQLPTPDELMATTPKDALEEP